MTNKKFQELTRAEKRVAIAKDVLISLKQKRIRANTGSYFCYTNFDEFDENDSAKKHINQIKCECCALGATLLSTVKFANTLTISDLRFYSGSHGRSWQIFKDIFTPKQLALIEYAFEHNTYGNRIAQNVFYEYISYKKQREAVDFGLKYAKEDERLVAIMENIIKNKGTFKP